MKSGMIRKATEEERMGYEGQYPLYGYVKHGGLQLVIEDLRCWPKQDPQYEVMAPDGFHFSTDRLHSLLCIDMKDIRDRLNGEELESCTEECI
jgi:hypothetical protein